MWMSKLLGYDFVIEYKKWKENKVANALSWVFEDLGLQKPNCSLISFPTPTWWQELKLSYSTDLETQNLLQQLKECSNALEQDETLRWQTQNR